MKRVRHAATVPRRLAVIHPRIRLEAMAREAVVKRRGATGRLVLLKVVPRAGGAVTFLFEEVRLP